MRIVIELEPKELQALGITEDTLIESFVDGGRLVIQPVDEDEARSVSVSGG